MNTTNPLTVEKYQEQAAKIVSLITKGDSLDAYRMLMQNTHLIKEEDPYVSDLYIKSLYQNLLLDKYERQARNLISMLKRNNPSLLELISSDVNIEFVRRIPYKSLEDISEKEEEVPEDGQTSAICEGIIERRMVE